MKNCHVFTNMVVSAEDVERLPVELQSSAKAALLASYNVEAREVRWQWMLFVWPHGLNKYQAQHFHPLTNWAQCCELILACGVSFDLGHDQINVYGQIHCSEHINRDVMAGKEIIERSCRLVVSTLASDYHGQ